MPGYSYPPELARDATFKVWLNGEPADVIATDGDAFVAFEIAGSTWVEIELPVSAEQAVLRPSKLGIAPEREGHLLRFQLEQPTNLFVDLMPNQCLFLYANPPEPVVPDGEGVRRLEPGRIYDEGDVHLGSDETLVIPGGAVLRGQIVIANATMVKVMGHGLIEGPPLVEGEERKRSIIIENCRNVTIQGVVMTKPVSWMVVIGNSEIVYIKEVRQIGHGYSTDGIDIVGSRYVHVDGCMLRNGDDNIAIKSLDLRPTPGVTADYTQNVNDIEVRNCAFINDLGGTAMEIGHELRCNTIQDVLFINIDVMGVHRYGAIFGIHNADHAMVKNIHWEDIRVEHHYDRLVSLRVIESRWSKDAERGHIQDIYMKDVNVHIDPYNPGYTHSLIGGYDADHGVTGVHFENFVHGGKVATGIEDLDLYLRHATEVTFTS